MFYIYTKNTRKTTDEIGRRNKKRNSVQYSQLNGWVSEKLLQCVSAKIRLGIINCWPSDIIIIQVFLRFNHLTSLNQTSSPLTSNKRKYQYLYEINLRQKINKTRREKSPLSSFTLCVCSKYLFLEFMFSILIVNCK